MNKTKMDFPCPIYRADLFANITYFHQLTLTTMIVFLVSVDSNGSAERRREYLCHSVTLLISFSEEAM
jgi:hypothetical protein